MSSPQTEVNLAQMHSDVEVQKELTEIIIFKQSPAPVNDDKATRQSDRADKSSDEEDEDWATEQMKSMKGRKHSRGRERKEYEEITERQDRTEKRGRKKVTHKNEKEGRAF